jgi:hypothetical protein
MMNSHETREAAERYVLEEYGEEYCIVPESVVEEEDLLAFTFQTRKYLETRRYEDMTLGQGPVILDKRNGRVYSYGSAFPMSAAIQDFRRSSQKEAAVKERFPEFDRRKLHDLVIHRVYRSAPLVDTLFSLSLTYVVPEVEAGATWRIPKAYTKELLWERIKLALPVRFCGLDAESVFVFFERTEQEEFCEYSVVESISRKRGESLVVTEDSESQ